MLPTLFKNAMRIVKTLSLFFLFMCMNSLSASMSMTHLCAWYPWKPEESTGCLRTGVTDSWICLFCLRYGLSLCSYDYPGTLK